MSAWRDAHMLVRAAHPDARDTEVAIHQMVELRRRVDALVHEAIADPDRWPDVYARSLRVLTDLGLGAGPGLAALQRMGIRCPASWLTGWLRCAREMTRDAAPDLTTEDTETRTQTECCRETFLAALHLCEQIDAAVRPLGAYAGMRAFRRTMLGCLEFSEREQDALMIAIRSMMATAGAARRAVLSHTAWLRRVLRHAAGIPIDPDEVLRRLEPVEDETCDAG